MQVNSRPATSRINSSDPKPFRIRLSTELAASTVKSAALNMARMGRKRLLPPVPLSVFKQRTSFVGANPAAGRDEYTYNYGKSIISQLVNARCRICKF